MKVRGLLSLLACLIVVLIGEARGTVLISNGRSDWRICVPAGREKIEAFAAQELSRYLGLISGVQLPVVYDSCGGALQIEIRAAARELDGYEIVVGSDRVAINGENPRGSLYGVYELLKMLGCRWYFLGKDGEVLPQQKSVGLSEGKIQSRSAFPQRSLIVIDEDDLHFGELPEWIDWAGKARINNLFICGHPPGQTALKQWWLAERDRLLPELHKRGIILEFGGHFMASLLPRHLFKDHPAYFRMNSENKRVNDFNFCPTNKETQQLIKENAKRIFRQLPEVKYHHLWPDDIWGGGWCSGPECQGLTASDQALLAANTVAEALAETDPHARLAYLTYHDTTKPPLKIKPHLQLFLLNAPRERCYAHSIADTRCRRNHEIYFPAWEKLLPLFETRQHADSHTFEYYHDLVLFKAMQPPLLRVMQEDAGYYADAKTPVLQSLMTRTRHFVAPPIALYAYSEFAWSPGTRAESVLRDFCNYFGPAAALMQAYFRKVEECFDLVLELDEFIEDPWPFDVLDYNLKPRLAARAKIEQLDQGRKLHQEAGDILVQAIEQSTNQAFRARLERERAVWEVHEASISLRQHRFAGWYYAEQFESTNDPAIGRKALTALESAIRAVESVQLWGAQQPKNQPYLSLFNNFSTDTRTQINSMRAKVYDRLQLYME